MLLVCLNTGPQLALKTSAISTESHNEETHSFFILICCSNSFIYMHVTNCSFLIVLSNCALVSNLQLQDWREESVIKIQHHLADHLVRNSQHPHHPIHHHLQFQLQNIWCPLLPSKITALKCTKPHRDKNIIT